MNFEIDPSKFNKIEFNLDNKASLIVNAYLFLCKEKVGYFIKVYICESAKGLKNAGLEDENNTRVSIENAKYYFLIVEFKELCTHDIKIIQINDNTEKEIVSFLQLSNFAKEFYKEFGIDKKYYTLDLR